MEPYQTAHRQPSPKFKNDTFISFQPSEANSIRQHKSTNFAADLDHTDSPHIAIANDFRRKPQHGPAVHVQDSPQQQPHSDRLLQDSPQHARDTLRPFERSFTLGKESTETVKNIRVLTLADMPGDAKTPHTLQSKACNDTEKSKALPEIPSETNSKFECLPSRERTPGESVKSETVRDEDLVSEDHFQTNTGQGDRARVTFGVEFQGDAMSNVFKQMTGEPGPGRQPDSRVSGLPATPIEQEEHTESGQKRALDDQSRFKKQKLGPNLGDHFEYAPDAEIDLLHEEHHDQNNPFVVKPDLLYSSTDPVKNTSHQKLYGRMHFAKVGSNRGRTDTNSIRAPRPGTHRGKNSKHVYGRSHTNEYTEPSRALVDSRVAYSGNTENSPAKVSASMTQVKRSMSVNMKGSLQSSNGFFQDLLNKKHLAENTGRAGTKASKHRMTNALGDVTFTEKMLFESSESGGLYEPTRAGRVGIAIPPKRAFLNNGRYSKSGYLGDAKYAQTNKSINFSKHGLIGQSSQLPVEQPGDKPRESRYTSGGSDLFAPPKRLSTLDILSEDKIPRAGLSQHGQSVEDLLRVIRQQRASLAKDLPATSQTLMDIIMHLVKREDKPRTSHTITLPELPRRYAPSVDTSRSNASQTRSHSRLVHKYNQERLARQKLERDLIDVLGSRNDHEFILKERQLLRGKLARARDQLAESQKTVAGLHRQNMELRKRLDQRESARKDFQRDKAFSGYRRSMSHTMGMVNDERGQSGTAVPKKFDPVHRPKSSYKGQTDGKQSLGLNYKSYDPVRSRHKSRPKKLQVVDQRIMKNTKKITNVGRPRTRSPNHVPGSKSQGTRVHSKNKPRTQSRFAGKKNNQKQPKMPNQLVPKLQHKNARLESMNQILKADNYNLRQQVWKLQIKTQNLRRKYQQSQAQLREYRGKYFSKRRASYTQKNLAGSRSPRLAVTGTKPLVQLYKRNAKQAIRRLPSPHTSGTLASSVEHRNGRALSASKKSRKAESLSPPVNHQRTLPNNMRVLKARPRKQRTRKKLHVVHTSNKPALAITPGPGSTLAAKHGVFDAKQTRNNEYISVINNDPVLEDTRENHSYIGTSKNAELDQHRPVGKTKAVTHFGQNKRHSSVSSPRERLTLELHPQKAQYIQEQLGFVKMIRSDLANRIKHANLRAQNQGTYT